MGGIARRFDLIRVEDLKIGGMTRSAKGRLPQVTRYWNPSAIEPRGS
jgi:hypothetical protein